MLQRLVDEAVDPESLCSALNLTPAILAEYLSSEIFQAAHLEHQKGVFSLSATSTRFEQLGVTLVEQCRGWTTVISSNEQDSHAIVTVPQHSFVHVLQTSGGLEFEKYAVDGYPTTPNDLPGTLSLSLLETRCAQTGDSFDLAAGASAYIFRGPVDGTTFLKIVGPTTEAISLSFDERNFAYRAIEFASEKETGNYFFANLIEGYHQEFGASAQTLDLLEAAAKSDDFDAFTRWKCLQVLGIASAAQAREVLVEMDTSGPGRLAAKARGVLQRNAI